ncbi:MAG: low specificity L-threonine aldolase [Candidatus Cloacimonadota bacterium]|nr:low specificity L-threonine aldolase [Candidatus Cloacimonadota bacterium]
MRDELKRGFASDNNAGIHPDVLTAMQNANIGHCIAYGDDIYTQNAIIKIKEHFGKEIDIYFTFNGTGSNVLALKMLTESYNSIICAETAHINVDECGAPEKFTGCKLLSIPTDNGKLTIKKIKYHMHGFDFEHHSQPKVISIAQVTEMGTVYTPDEIKKITDYAHENGIFVHIDGARLCNAAVGLDRSLREITTDAGVDVLSLGLTKNGAMNAEAIIFFNKEISENFKYYRKQGMQLASKMRFMAVQFETLLSNDLWKKNAEHANKMAKILAESVAEFPQIQITQKVEANGVFAIVPFEIIPKLQEEFFFYIWDEHKSEVRWMTSFDTQLDDINKFVLLLRKLMK